MYLKNQTVQQLNIFLYLIVRHLIYPFILVKIVLKDAQPVHLILLVKLVPKVIISLVKNYNHITLVLNKVYAKMVNMLSIV